MTPMLLNITPYHDDLGLFLFCGNEGIKTATSLPVIPTKEPLNSQIQNVLPFFAATFTLTPSNLNLTQADGEMCP